MDVKKAVIPSDGFGMRFLPANFNCIPTKYPENKKQVFSKQPFSPFPVLQAMRLEIRQPIGAIRAHFKPWKSGILP